MPEREERILRVERNVGLLRADGSHRRRELERQPALGRGPAEQNVEDGLVRGAERADDRRTSLDQLRDDRRPLEMQHEDRRDLPSQSEQLTELGLLEIEITGMELRLEKTTAPGLERSDPADHGHIGVLGSPDHLAVGSGGRGRDPVEVETQCRPRAAGDRRS